MVLCWNKGCCKTLPEIAYETIILELMVEKILIYR
jgi:hypothetical protein